MVGFGVESGAKAPRGLKSAPLFRKSRPARRVLGRVQSAPRPMGWHASAAAYFHSSSLRPMRRRLFHIS